MKFWFIIFPFSFLMMKKRRVITHLQKFFNGLENMSNTSTLFDGIDEEPPPPLTGNPTKQITDKSSSITKVEDQSQQDPLQSRVSEIDPFDVKKYSEMSRKMTEKHDKEYPKRHSVLISNSEKFFDPAIEIAQLREELRLKNEELQRISLKMNTLHEKQDHSMLNMTDNNLNNSSSYHLAFLFASPLVRRINSSIEMIMQLDYQNEISGIEKQLKGVQHEIKYKVNVATQNNFRSVIVDAPFALHFTGHGIQNDQKALGSAYMQYKDKGDILLLENENGMADYLFEKDLKKLVQLSKANREFSHNYEVVFVSS